MNLSLIKNFPRTLKRTALCFALAFSATGFAKSDRESLEQEVKAQVSSKVNFILTKFCPESCQLVDVNLEIGEQIHEIENLGFEGASDQQAARSYVTEKIYIQIQIDNSQTRENRQRLEVLIQNHLKNYASLSEISWLTVELPNVDQSASVAEGLQNKVKLDLGDKIRTVIRKYCPDTCILANIQIDGQLVTPDEASGVDPASLVRADSGHSFLKIAAVQVDLSMDQKIPDKDRENILQLMRAKTKNVRPINFEVNLTEFPEPYADKLSREQESAKDPYGLEKLRRTLILFKELAGTKEIISTQTSNSNTSSSSKDSSSNASSSSRVENSEERSKNDSHEQFIYLGILLGVLFLFGIVLLKVQSAQKDAKLLVAQANSQNRGQSDNNEKPIKAQASIHTDDKQKDNFAKKIAVDDLKRELTNVFVSSPRVAQETFTRFLLEEGVEETSKYVHIFGKMIIFELLTDPALQRNIYELSEYYHKSNFEFSVDEEFRLLNILKTKVVAGEIKVLARNTLDQYDFLNVLDPNQIHTLILDESPSVQSIVLTQLNPKRRRTVFELFDGQAKVDLMKELSRVNAIPKEYLFNVAFALARKAKSKPEFDTQSLRSSDILLELLERSNLKEQRILMKNLAENNPEAARAIKLKLVTIELLPYLKDGHLLEIIFVLEREDLLTFLVGSPDHIKQLVLAKAPDELRSSWLEELQNTSIVEESKYRLVEMVVLSKIRQLTNQGAIRLLEINEMIFHDLKGQPAEKEQRLITKRNLVA